MTSTQPATPQAPGDRQAKRAAVLFADMVGFSKHMEQDAVGSASQVARSIQLFRALIGDYGGQIANVAGDGILALFDRADKALQFAIQIQTEFRDQSVWGDGEPIEFRIGLSIGDVTIHGEIAYGHCINVAARLQAMAEPSSILLTSALRSAVPEVSGISLRSLGQPRLKNISESIEVFAVESAGDGARRRAIVVRSSPDVAPVRHPAIAVLALTNLSGDSAQQSSLRRDRRGHNRQSRPVPQSHCDRASLVLLVQSEGLSHRSGSPGRRFLPLHSPSAVCARPASAFGSRLNSSMRHPKACFGPIASMSNSRICSTFRKRLLAPSRLACRSRSTRLSTGRNPPTRATCAPTDWCCGAATCFSSSPRRRTGTRAACSRKRSKSRLTTAARTAHSRKPTTMTGAIVVG